jgi:ParB family chromosome partitioning protein
MREVGDEEALELSLVENLQREDLNPVEQARAFQRLIEQFHLTQDEVAERTGKDRATVANSVRLLMLSEGFLQWIEEGKLTAGHGRALLAIDDPKLRLALAQKASQGKLNVRQLERMATRRARRAVQVIPAELNDPNRIAALKALEERVGSRVTLHMPSDGKAGQLVLEFYDEEQLEILYKRLMS